MKAEEKSDWLYVFSNITNQSSIIMNNQTSALLQFQLYPVSPGATDGQKTQHRTQLKAGCRLTNADWSIVCKSKKTS